MRAMIRPELSEMVNDPISTLLREMAAALQSLAHEASISGTALRAYRPTLRDAINAAMGERGKA